MKKLFALNLFFICAFAFQISAQTKLVVNDKIPADLLITLKRQGGWGGNYNETTINAAGEFTFQSRPVFKITNTLPAEVYIAGKRVKNPKYSKPKLSEAKLKLLIAEFEKIQFFRFGKDFPQEDEKRYLSFSDQQTEIISIRINGQTKEVSNYLGDDLKRTRILRDLAERIRGASVWNYENDEIPELLEISYRITDGAKIEREFIITGEGKIIERIYTVSFYPEMGKDLPVFVKNKTVGKLSNKRLRQLLDEFEKGLFSTFKYSILTKYAGCANDAGLNESKRTHIQVVINHIGQMYASLYKDCNPLPETEAARFENMNRVLTTLFKELGVVK